MAGGIAALAVGGFFFAWSGLYSVAASAGHWRIVEYALAFVMQNSVETRAMAIDAPPLDDDDLAILGAGAYHSGCAWCHGAPGIPRNPVTMSMLPAPPDLSNDMREWKDEELFWIVKHGIKYTGMPAWASQRRDDEVWAVVAFLRRIELTDAATYHALALGFADTSESGREIVTEEDAVEAAVACVRCHGADVRGPRSALVPILHGQPADALIAALRAYADGRRESGVMQPLASDLSAEDIERVAKDHAALPAPPRDVRDPGGADLAAGGAIFEHGDAANGIPACISCHGDEGLETYPRLAGQNRIYVETQLSLWKVVTTRHTEAAAIMAPIARSLSDEQIRDVAAYLESLPVVAPEAPQ